MDPKARIRALVDQGNTVEVDANIPLKRYFRSGMEMAKMAGIYEEENNLESAFILYFRYVTLFVEKIKNHPEYHKYSAVDKTKCNKRVKEVLPKAEALKDCLTKKYQREYNEAVEHQKALEKVLRAEQEMAEKRKMERDLREEEEKEKYDASKSSKLNNVHISPYSEHITEDSSIGNLAFPTEFLLEGHQANISEGRGNKDIPFLYDQTYSGPHVPSRDLKPQASKSMPAVNRGTKPLSLLSANHDLKGSGLRSILIPKELLEKFLSLAYSNTSKNIETCGILAGKLTLNKFMITHLLVPQQMGTPDSCTTQHEEELFDQQDKYDLITLGWIHTHPTQTAFLSSVDLHTHCSYQLMMPEAIAIVCAPKFKETGYFTLTPNHGLQYIANCRENGFHPHPSEPPLFQAAEHVQIDPSLMVQVIDLRR